MGPPMNTSMTVAGKLIEHVKKHPILYDSSDVDYRNNEKKDQLWEHIAEDLKENVMDLKKRWRNLRDTYVKLLKLVKGGEHDPVFEAAAVRKYHRWVWTKEMEFFRSHFTYGNQLDIEIPKPSSPMRNTRSNSDLLKKKAIKREVTSSPGPPPTKKVKTKKNLKIKKLQKPAITVKQFERTSKSSKNVANIKSRTSLTASPLTSTVNAIELDATDRLFLAHAQNIKQFTARRQALTKLKIAEVIMEQEILHQEDVELASISATTARLIPSNCNQRDDSPQPFESVCGYTSDDGEVEGVFQQKTEADVENPVELDGTEHI